MWFRRDLRDYDHAALFHALESSDQVYCAFVFDTDILDQLPTKQTVALSLFGKVYKN